MKVVEPIISKSPRQNCVIINFAGVVVQSLSIPWVNHAALTRWFLRIKLSFATAAIIFVEQSKVPLLAHAISLTHHHHHHQLLINTREKICTTITAFWSIKLILIRRHFLLFMMKNINIIYSNAMWTVKIFYEMKNVWGWKVFNILHIFL